MFEENWQVYGVRKVRRQLGPEGVEVGRCTLGRVRKNVRLQGITRGNPDRETVPDTKALCPLDKVDWRFRVPAPNMLWVVHCGATGSSPMEYDFTYVAT